MPGQKLREYYRSIPSGIKAISLGTAFRWIGWGMVEPVLPVFLFSILGNYTVASIVDSAGRIVFLLFLPLAGKLADRMDLKKFLIAGLIFFVFDGLGYFVAGLTGAAAWIVFANILDGFGVISDVIGRSTYIRRYSPSERISTMFGFSTSAINVGYMVGIIASIFLVQVLPVAWIFFSIIPTTLVALAIYWRYLTKEEPVPKKDKAPFWQDYAASWRDVVTWSSDVRILAGFALLLSMLQAVGTFIVPIYAHVNGASLSKVALISLLFNIPWLFSEMLGRIADRFQEKVLPFGIIATTATLGAFAVFPGYKTGLGLVLILEIFLILATLAVEGVVTRRVAAERFGRVSAVFEGMKDLGKFLGPLALGLIADLSGPRTLFLTAAICTFATLLLLPKIKAARPAGATRG